MNEIYVTRPSLPPFEEYAEEIKGIWETHRLTNMGSKHLELQERLLDYLDVKAIELFTNGHMALELTLQAMNLKGEVITTPFTFASTTHAIIRSGLKPVFCDINPLDFTMDVSKIESLITDATSAILPVHVYGNVCAVEEIECIAQKYGLKVIYDAAHAVGVTYKGKGIASYGDAACFSFHATKVFNTIEGGAVCFRDTELGDVLRKIKNFGIRDAEHVDYVGCNAKMNEFCAAMGICNLRRLEEEIREREVIAKQYRKALDSISGIRLNDTQEFTRPNYAYFPIVIEEEKFGASRDEVFLKLKEKHIFARKYFYPLTNAFECFQGQYFADHTPVALRMSQRILTLPIYVGLSETNVEKICNIILSCKK